MFPTESLILDETPQVTLYRLGKMLYTFKAKWRAVTCHRFVAVIGKLLPSKGDPWGTRSTLTHHMQDWHCQHLPIRAHVRSNTRQQQQQQQAGIRFRWRRMVVSVCVCALIPSRVGVVLSGRFQRCRFAW